jgi:hypothetical protein
MDFGSGDYSAPDEVVQGQEEFARTSLAVFFDQFAHSALV